MADLDSILSGTSEPVLTPETTEPETTAVEATPETETPEPEGEEPADGQRTVPLAALHAEKQKAKRYTEQVASFEQTLKDRETAWERRFSELLQRFAPQQQKPETPPPDFFADPDAALSHRITPIMERMQQVERASTLRASRAEALAAHGREAVAKMEEGINAAMQAGDPELGPLREAMLQSDDPVGLAMSWHQRRSVLNEVGSDPAAYKEKLKAEILAELQQQPAPVAGVMPSNLAGARNVGTRSGPAWAGPTPLSSIFK